jgi:hypothetical protein
MRFSLYTLQKIDYSKRKQKNRKKEKESNFAGRDAVRPKGIGISPEGWLVRHEQGIMPKSFCQTENSPSYLRFLFFFRKI